MYIKGDFYLHPTNIRKTVVFGHTKVSQIHGRSDIWFGEGKIGIDGGCATGQQLNGLVWENDVYATYMVKMS